MAHLLKIELQGSDPKIHRTVIVPEQFSFHQLHQVIQNCMNWEDSHLYQFCLGEPFHSDAIKIPDPYDEEFDYQTFDATRTYLQDYFNDGVKKVNYIYDFGDSWVHTVKLLKKPKEEVFSPICINGENDAPIEDCGGIWGFYEMMEILSLKGNSAEKRELKEWLGLRRGQTYESRYGFDIDKVNKNLIKYVTLY